MTPIISDTGWKVTYVNSTSQDMERIIKFQDTPTEAEIRKVFELSGCNERMHYRKLDKNIYCFNGTIITRKHPLFV